MFILIRTCWIATHWVSAGKQAKQLRNIWPLTLDNVSSGSPGICEVSAEGQEFGTDLPVVLRLFLSRSRVTHTALYVPNPLTAHPGPGDCKEL